MGRNSGLPPRSTPSAKIHATFHVSQLKKKLRENVTHLSSLLQVDSKGALKLELEETIARRMVKSHIRPMVELLI